MACDPAGALGDWSCADAVAVAVPDHTRPVDVPAALAALAPRLRGGMRVVVGLGLHRSETAAERAGLTRWDPVEHDPDDAVPTRDIGGIPGGVFRGVAEADWSLSVGVAELHQYAGLSGGHKGVAVGCGARATIAALHHRDRVLAPGVEIGRLQGNPFRAAVDALGEAARCRAALVQLPARGLWLFGDPRAVLEEAARRLDPWERVPHPAGRVVLRVPATKATSLYQASRAATYLALSPRPPLLPGAALILDAACPEGLGAETGFIAALRSCPPPWTALLSGPPPTGPGAQRAVMIALLAARYRLSIAGCSAPEALREVGLTASGDAPTLTPDTLDVLAPFSRVPQLA